MTDNRIPAYDEILGALLWVRNQYELYRPDISESVIKEADHILNMANVGTKHPRAFQEWMRRNWRDGRSPHPETDASYRARITHEIATATGQSLDNMGLSVGIERRIDTDAMKGQEQIVSSPPLPGRGEKSKVGVPRRKSATTKRQG